MQQEIIAYRYESFGGILHLRRPSALVYVDKDYMLSLGYSPSPLWDCTRKVLSAPTEVHLAVTNHCSAGCKHCYMDSRDHSAAIQDGVVEGEMGPDGLIRAVDELARLRVFHMALGGGESFEMPWLPDVVRHIRSRGIVPNITTNGHYIDEHNVFWCQNFGQINLSLSDVPYPGMPAAEREHFERADRTLVLLRKAGVKAGINCVVSRQNFDRLESIVRYARCRRLKEIEFLRIKPAGRAGAIYEDLRLTPEQTTAFFPRICELMKRYRVTLKLDCSFTPMICVHEPDRERMDFFAVLGCDGGNTLAGATADGYAAPCSFYKTSDVPVDRLSDFWDRPETFAEFRNWPRLAPEPCASCHYLPICRGGCHAVSRHYFGDPQMADPECPKVRRETPILN